MIGNVLIQIKDFVDAGSNNRIQYPHLNSTGQPEEWLVSDKCSYSGSDYYVIQRLSDSSISYFAFRGMGSYFKVKS
jgi:hypothetical protein